MMCFNNQKHTLQAIPSLQSSLVEIVLSLDTVTSSKQEILEHSLPWPTASTLDRHRRICMPQIENRRYKKNPRSSGRAVHSLSSCLRIGWIDKFKFELTSSKVELTRELRSGQELGLRLYAGHRRLTDASTCIERLRSRCPKSFLHQPRHPFQHCLHYSKVIQNSDNWTKIDHHLNWGESKYGAHPAYIRRSRQESINKACSVVGVVQERDNQIGNIIETISTLKVDLLLAH